VVDATQRPSTGRPPNNPLHLMVNGIPLAGLVFVDRLRKLWRRIRGRDAPRSSWTKAGKSTIAASMYSKGMAFIGAAILLRQQGGYQWVVLHLLCQGIEIVMKSFLLIRDYDKFKPRLKKLGHNLEKIVKVTLKEFKLNPLPPAVATELKALNSLYATHLLRYGSGYDILVDPKTIAVDRVWRRLHATIRLARRKPSGSATG
jgi:hypothetical protein